MVARILHDCLLQLAMLLSATDQLDGPNSFALDKPALARLLLEASPAGGQVNNQTTTRLAVE